MENKVAKYKFIFIEKAHEDKKIILYLHRQLSNVAIYIRKNIFNNHLMQSPKKQCLKLFCEGENFSLS
jgi:hypothetical protein